MRNNLVLRANLNETTGGVFTGGNVSVVGDYVVHTFNDNGTFNITGDDLDVEVLLVGKGGSGGQGDGGQGYGGGGGGAEVVVTSMPALPSGTYSVVVADASEAITSFNGTTAVSGDSGEDDSQAGAGGDSTDYTGGSATSPYNSSGAGGAGAGSNGNNGYDGVSTTIAGQGGSGITNDWLGTTKTYGAGGGGATQNLPSVPNEGAGGSSEAGDGAKGSITTDIDGGDADANSGAGGGGATGDGLRGGAGSGVVIIRYLLSNVQRPVTYDLDTFETIPFRVDVSAIQNSEIGNVFGVASQTIELPGSKINNTFFNAAFNVNSPIVKGFERSVPCQVLQSGAEVFTGNLILNEVITDGVSDTTYSVTLVNESVDFAEKIKETYLSNLDFSDLTHPYTITSVTSSWEDGIASGDVYYPLADYGLDGTDSAVTPIQFGGTPGKIDNTNTPMQISQFKPSVRVKAIMDRIFDSAGYQYESTFFDSAEFQTIYTLTTANDKLGITNNQSQDAGFEAKKAASQVLSGPTTFQEDIIFPTEIYDPGSSYNTGNSQFTIASAGTYAFRSSLDFRKSTIGKISLCTVQLIKNGSTILATQYYDIKQPVDGTMNFTTAGFNLTAGDVIKLRATWEGYDVSISPIDLELLSSSTFGTIYAPVLLVGADVDMGAQFDPTIKALDFLKGIIQKFNLVIEPKKNERNTLIIEPFDTWAEQGVVKDWSSKYDRATKVSVKHPIQSQPQKVTFTDGFDGDALTDYAKNNFDSELPYGGISYVSDSDIPQGERKVGGFFSPLPTKGVPQGSGVIIPHLYRKDGADTKSFKFKPRIGYRINNRTAVGATNGQFFVYDAQSDSSVGVTTYSTISSVQAYPIGSGSSLHYDAGRWYPFHQNQSNGKTPLGAFNTYWGRYMNELYDESARILTLNMQFDPIELKDIQLNDKIFIDNAYYRINKISGFNITDRDSVQVELLKTPLRQFKFPRRRIGDIDIGVTDVGDFLPRGVVTVRGPLGEVVTDENQLKEFSSLAGYTFLSGSVYWDATYNTYINALQEQAVIGSVQVDDNAGAIVGTQDGGTIGQGADKIVIVGTDNIVEANVKNAVISGDTISIGNDSDNIAVLSSKNSSILSGSKDVTLIGSINATLGGNLNTMVSSENSQMIGTKVTQSSMIGVESVTFDGGGNTFERHTHIGGDGFLFYQTSSAEGIETFTNSVGLGQLPNLPVAVGVPKEGKVILGNSILTGAQYLKVTEVSASAAGTYDMSSDDDSYLTYFNWSGGNGTFSVDLPSATTNRGRFIRFMTDGTFNNASKIVNITPLSPQTIDGDPEYPINKDYNGLAILSTGTEWIIIQERA